MRIPKSRRHSNGSSCGLRHQCLSQQRNGADRSGARERDPSRAGQRERQPCLRRCPIGTAAITRVGARHRLRTHGSWPAGDKSTDREESYSRTENCARVAAAVRLRGALCRSAARPGQNRLFGRVICGQLCRSTISCWTQEDGVAQ